MNEQARLNFQSLLCSVSFLFVYQKKIRLPSKESTLFSFSKFFCQINKINGVHCKKSSL